MQLPKFLKDTEGNAILTGIGVLIVAVILIAMGGLLANTFTNAAALPTGNAFNVSTVVASNYSTAVTISFAAVLILIAVPALFMLFAIFGGRRGGR